MKDLFMYHDPNRSTLLQLFNYYNKRSEGMYYIACNSSANAVLIKYEKYVQRFKNNSEDILI